MQKETEIGMRVAPQDENQKNFPANAKSAAMISFVLALPIALFYPIIRLEIEPFHGLLNSLLTNDGSLQSAFGLAVFIGAMLLLPVAFVVNLAPIVRNLRAGNSLMANPINLLLAVAMLTLIAMTWGGLLIDQIPCLMGVPNCD